ncbi:hypothetical protein Tco_1244528 [Tanacetum coccineum]
MKKTNLGTVVKIMKTEEGDILEDDADDLKVDVPSLYQDIKSRVVIENVSTDVLEVNGRDRGLGTESNVRSARSLGKEIVLDFDHSAIRLTSHERDLQTALMESRSLRGDIYGQSSFAGHNAANTESVTFVMLRPCKTSMKCALFLSVMLSPLLFTTAFGPSFNAASSSSGKRRNKSRRVLPSSTRSQHTSNRNVRRRSARPIMRGNESSSYRDLGDCNQCCVHWGALFWYEEWLKGADYNGKGKALSERVSWMLFLKMNFVKIVENEARLDYIQWRACITRNFKLSAILEPGKLAKVDKDAILVDVVRELAVDQLVENIFESFKIIIQGKVFWIRAKEVSGWAPDFTKDNESEDGTDDEKRD